MFSWVIYKFFKKSVLKNIREQSLLHWLFYQIQIIYLNQFNRNLSSWVVLYQNLSTCVLQAKKWFMLSRKECLHFNITLKLKTIHGLIFRCKVFLKMTNCDCNNFHYLNFHLDMISAVHYHMALIISYLDIILPFALMWMWRCSNLLAQS